MDQVEQGGKCALQTAKKTLRTAHSPLRTARACESWRNQVMKCTNVLTLQNGMQVNCGSCLACRVNYTSQWKLRLMYELTQWDSACFLTLTYSDDWLRVHNHPNELNKKDVSDFIKRLRYYAGKPLKHYTVGEYGSSTKRAHYHSIVFGLSPYDEKDRNAVSAAWLPRCEKWQFDRWRGEKSGIAEVTPDSIAYVTGYVQKKLSGPLARAEYDGRQFPFSQCSKGLGLQFALENSDRLIDNGFTYIQGKRIGLPRYYREKLGITITDKTETLHHVDVLRKEVEYLRKEFDDYMKKFGLDDYSDKNLDRVSREFEQWYETRQFDITESIYKDFMQRSKLRSVL